MLLVYRYVSLFVRKVPLYVDLLPGESIKALSEPGGRAVIASRFENLDGAAADLCGLFFLTSVLLEDGQALVAEGTRMASLDGGPAVLDESYEIRLVTTILKMSLSERDVGKLKVSGLFGEVESRTT